MRSSLYRLVLAKLGLTDVNLALYAPVQQRRSKNAIKQPGKGVGIHPVPRSAKKQRTRQQRHAQNRVARAGHYEKFCGQIGNGNVNEWHSVLHGLSNGTGGGR